MAKNKNKSQGLCFRGVLTPGAHAGSWAIISSPLPSLLSCVLVFFWENVYEQLIPLQWKREFLFPVYPTPFSELPLTASPGHPWASHPGGLSLLAGWGWYTVPLLVHETRWATGFSSFLISQHDWDSSELHPVETGELWPEEGGKEAGEAQREPFTTEGLEERSMWDQEERLGPAGHLMLPWRP